MKLAIAFSLLLASVVLPACSSPDSLLAGPGVTPKNVIPCPDDDTIMCGLKAGE
jgi:hypothetical protein